MHWQQYNVFAVYSDTLIRAILFQRRKKLFCTPLEFDLDSTLAPRLSVCDVRPLAVPGEAVPDFIAEPLELVERCDMDEPARSSCAPVNPNTYKN